MKHSVTFGFLGEKIPDWALQTLDQMLVQCSGNLAKRIKTPSLNLSLQIMIQPVDRDTLSSLAATPGHQFFLIAFPESPQKPLPDINFTKADLMLNLNLKDASQRHIKRFVELLFGNPFHTPDPPEQAMMMAHVARLASSDLSRQVGAALFDAEGDLISTGYNEVPKAGGGFYTNECPSNNDARDFQLQRNSSFDAKKEIYQQILAFLKEHKKIPVPDDFLDQASLEKDLIDLKEHTNFMNILEYSRNVHAEMSCLISALGTGRSVKGGSLYTTTFPCHKCTKHLVAAGLKKVVYLDSFNKSRAFDLFGDSITFPPPEATQKKALNRDKVVFESFLGVTPRQYSLFEALKREDHKEKMVTWIPRWRL
tara:strand:+ start:47 stop:1147 length:1101 start_codon:yes stop_codon:yes gene_type:complete